MLDKMYKSVIIELYALEDKCMDKNAQNTVNVKAIDVKNAPIGVIDSGVGGLSVLKCLQQALPQESFIYLGDTARTPYGSRSEKEIRSFVEDMLVWLDKQGVKLVVVACNTLTMLGIDSLKKDHKFLLVGKSKGEKLLLAASKKKRIGVLATQFTIGTEAHKEAVLNVDAEAKVFGVACPAFVPLIEGEAFDSVELAKAIEEYTSILKQNDVDALILGCTHYPFIKEEIAKTMGSDVAVIDPAEATAELVKAELARHDLLNAEGAGSVKICCTADLERVERLANKMLPQEQCCFEKIKLKA